MRLSRLFFSNYAKKNLYEIEARVLCHRGHDLTRNVF